MNIFSLTRNHISASFLALVTITSLLLSALPVAFFVAEATTPSYTTQPFTQAELDDNWIVDRAVPSGGYASVSFAGRSNVLQMSIDSINADSRGTFYQTEGIKRALPSDTTAIKADLYVDSDWNTKDVRAGLWGVGEDEFNEISAYPIIEFTTAGNGGYVGWRIFNDRDGGWIQLPDVPVVYDTWTTLELQFNRVTTTFDVFIDDSLVGSSVAVDSVDLREIILNGFNYNTNNVSDSYSAHWSEFMYGEIPPKPEIEIEVRGDTFDTTTLAGWLFNRDQNTKTPFEFNADESVLGDGSLYVLPIGANAADKFIGELFINQKINQIEEISYDYRLGDTVPAGKANEFYANAYMNFDNSGNFGHCVYSIVPTNGSAGWHTMTFDPNQDYPVRQRTSAPSPCPASPSDMGLNAELRMFALNLGDTSANDVGVDGYFDNVVITTRTQVTVYDFEPDVTKPNGAINTPADNSVVGSSFVVSGTASDGESGLAEVLYRVNQIDAIGGIFVANVLSGTASGTEEWSYNVTGLGEGFYRVRAEVIDNAGNIRFLYHDVEVDTTKPNVTITSPSHQAALDNVPFAVTGTASDAKTGIKEVKYTVTNITGIGGTFVDLIASSTATGQGNWSFEVPALENGFYRLKVQAFDEAGNWRYKYHDIEVRGTRAFISVINPADGFIAYEDFEITVHATDSFGLGQVVINLKDEDGNNLAPCLNVQAGGVTDFTVSCTVDVDSLEPGIYGFRTNARDLEGNISNTVSQTFEVRELPVASLTITSPAIDGEVVSGAELFTAEYIDDDLIVDSFQWAIRAGTCERGQGTIAGNVDGFNDNSTFVGTTFTAQFDATELEDGEYCFVVNPREQAGERDLRAARTFVVETPLLTCEIKSDTGTLIIENNEYAVETYKHRNWTALIPGAKWIWETFYVEDPTVNTTRTFTETFVVNGIDNATLEVAADNGYQLFVNNQLVSDRRAIENNFQTHTKKTFDVASYLVEGENTFKIEVTNKGVNNSTKLQNPAGVLYKLTINAETACEITTEPESTDTEGPSDEDTEGEGGSDDGDTEGPGDTENPSDENGENPEEGDTEGSVGGDTDTENNNSGGSSVGTFVASRLAPALPQTLVLGATTSQCGMLLTDYMRMGIENNPNQVRWLQFFLFGQGYFDVTVNGEFDAATDAAVRAFQEKHRADILDPWVTNGILTVSNPSGWVYQLTRYKINNIICPGSEPMPNLI